MPHRTEGPTVLRNGRPAPGTGRGDQSPRPGTPSGVRARSSPGYGLGHPVDAYRVIRFSCAGLTPHERARACRPAPPRPHRALADSRGAARVPRAPRCVRTIPKRPDPRGKRRTPTPDRACGRGPGRFSRRPDSRAARIRSARDAAVSGKSGCVTRAVAHRAGSEAADALPLNGPAPLRTLSPCQPPACVASPFLCSRVRNRSMSESPRRCSRRARACRTRCGCAARHLVS